MKNKDKNYQNIKGFVLSNYFCKKNNIDSWLDLSQYLIDTFCKEHRIFLLTNIESANQKVQLKIIQDQTLQDYSEASFFNWLNNTGLKKLNYKGNHLRIIKNDLFKELKDILIIKNKILSLSYKTYQYDRRFWKFNNGYLDWKWLLFIETKDNTYKQTIPLISILFSLNEDSKYLYDNEYVELISKIEKAQSDSNNKLYLFNEEKYFNVVIHKDFPLDKKQWLPIQNENNKLRKIFNEWYQSDNFLQDKVLIDLLLTQLLDTSCNKKFHILLIGKTNSGKSTFLEFINSLLPPGHSENFDLEEFGDFSRHLQYQDYLFLYSPETIQGKKLASNKIKKFLGGEPFPVRRLYVSPYYDIFNGIYITASNDKVLFQGSHFGKDGMARRILELPFDKYIMKKPFKCYLNPLHNYEKYFIDFLLITIQNKVDIIVNNFHIISKENMEKINYSQLLLNTKAYKESDQLKSSDNYIVWMENHIKNIIEVFKFKKNKDNFNSNIIRNGSILLTMGLILDEYRFERKNFTNEDGFNDSVDKYFEKLKEKCQNKKGYTYIKLRGMKKKFPIRVDIIENENEETVYVVDINIVEHRKEVNEKSL